jgi:hypothetical protein
MSYACSVVNLLTQQPGMVAFQAVLNLYAYSFPCVVVGQV